jgi:hypothetical protein
MVFPNKIFTKLSGYRLIQNIICSIGDWFLAEAKHVQKCHLYKEQKIEIEKKGLILWKVNGSDSIHCLFLPKSTFTLLNSTLLNSTSSEEA